MSRQDDDLLALHQALIDGDVGAPALLAARLVPILKARLSWLNARLGDPNIVESAIGQTIAAYLSRPDRYDPSRAPLDGYLAMDAAGDVKNELARRGREVANDETVQGVLVELGVRERNYPVEDKVLDAIDLFDLPRAKVEAARRELQKLTPRDRELAQLVVDGVRSYAEWAAVLGIGHLPHDVQEREVKRQKDRIKKRLARMGERIG